MTKSNKCTWLQGWPHAIALFVLLAVAWARQVDAAVLETESESSFGTFNGVEFIRYTGRFVGVTSKGAYRVPYEIIAPANPWSGNGVVIVEPPHFLLGLPGRDGTLGHTLLFGRGYSHASVGFSQFLGNLLDPSAQDAMIAGQAVKAKRLPPFIRDVDILKQFSDALTSDPYAREILDGVNRRYAYGVSQTAEAWFELHYNAGVEGLFDLTLMHVPAWRPPFAEPPVLDALPETFTPLPGIGKVMMVGAEGDQFFSEAIQFRNAVTGPTANRNYRLYEVAGAPHQPFPVPLNPLDNGPVARAMLVAGDRWVRRGIRPPRSLLIETDAAGIVRDADGNALGGVRFPDVVLGRARFIAATFDPPPGFIPGLVGLWEDLACEPRPGSISGKPRFRSHRQYVRGVARQALRLMFGGYLLYEDARALFEAARGSDVGKPGYCDS